MCHQGHLYHSSNNGTQENMAVFHDQARSKEDTYETKLQLGQGGQGGQGGQLKLENAHRWLGKFHHDLTVLPNPGIMAKNGNHPLVWP